jgi:Reverse transcriptase (RNA-dependent DNA polymerase)
MSYYWYLKKFGRPINRRTHVVPIGHAIQGHPEAGNLWEGYIVDFLCNRLGFRATTHERNLYPGTVDGEDTLVCRQVDDFNIATKDPATAGKLIALINAFVTTESKGLAPHYNGVDVLQTRDYIKLSCKTYIDRVLQTHGWTTPGANESDCHDAIPISPASINSLALLKGPAEATLGHKKLEQDLGFSYRQVLDKLIYAYVICRLDIGYAVTFLARFSQAPAHEHY